MGLSGLEVAGLGMLHGVVLEVPVMERTASLHVLDESVLHRSSSAAPNSRLVPVSNGRAPIESAHIQPLVYHGNWEVYLRRQVRNVLSSIAVAYATNHG